MNLGFSTQKISLPLRTSPAKIKFVKQIIMLPQKRV